MSKIAVVLSLILPVSAVAATLLVPGDYPSIQSAINAAVDGDTVLVSPGQYQETVNFLGKAIVARSTSGPAATLIYTPSGYTCAYFGNGEGRDSVLEGFWLRNNWGDKPSPSHGGGSRQDGGGCYILDSSPTIRGNWIKDCEIEGPGADGGGIYISGGSPLIEGNEITNNTGYGSTIAKGGGIYCAGDSSEIIGNIISQNEASDGAGIYCGGARRTYLATWLTAT